MRILRFILLAATTTVLLEACQRRPEPAQVPQSPLTPPFASIPTGPLEELDTLLWVSYSGSPWQIQQRLGEAVKIDSVSTVNIHDGSTDQIVTLHFRGSTAQLYHVTNADKYLIQRVQLDDITRLTPFGLTAGMTATQVVGVLRTPDRVDSTGSNQMVLHYEVGEEAADYIDFHFVDNKLQSAVFLPYLD